MSDFRELYFINTMSNVICHSRVSLLIDIKNCCYNNSAVKGHENINNIKFRDTNKFFKFYGS